MSISRRMNRRFCYGFYSLMAVAVCLQGQEVPATQGKSVKERIGDIKRQIAGEGEAVDDACRGIRELLAMGENPGDLRNTWLAQLAKKGRHEEVAEFALAESLLIPDAKTIATMMEMRARALLELGRVDEAMVAAKIDFNVCLIPETEKAMALLCECVAKANPGDAAAARRYRLELVSGTVSPLKAIRVDGAVFAKAIESWKGKKEKFGDRLMYGDLLLAADRPQDALAVYRELYKEERNAKEHAQAGEGIARALRAEDGGMTRANAWLAEMSQGSVVRLGEAMP